MSALQSLICPAIGQFSDWAPFNRLFEFFDRILTSVLFHLALGLIKKVMSISVIIEEWVAGALSLSGAN